MHKKGQMVPFSAWWLTGFFFTEVTVGFCANKHSHNTIVIIGPCLNGGSSNLTPATLASVLLPNPGIVVAPLWLDGSLAFSLHYGSSSVRAITGCKT